MPDPRTIDPDLLRWEHVTRRDGAPQLDVVGAHAGSVTDFVLACVTGGLQVGQVEHFLVERSRSGSRVAVPATRASETVEVLRRCGERGPLRVRLGRDSRRWTGWARDLPPWEELDLSAGLLAHVTVTEPASGLRLGRRQGCLLELWPEDDDGGLVSPSPNLRTPGVTAEDRAQRRLRDDGGLRVPVVPPFDRPGAFDVTFPVDAVMLWVDGSDPAWRESRRRRRVELGLSADDPGLRELLYDDHGELRYLLRSLELYAPWLRRLHLVTAGQRPDWLRDDHPWLRVVDHSEFIEASALPVFSPRPITSRMHRIDGLAEHFLYFNDDMLLARAVAPELFFASNGTSRFFLSKSTIPRGPTEEPHLGARQVMQQLISDRYGINVSRTFRHTPSALTRRMMGRLEEVFPDAVGETVHRPFRTVHDIVPEWLHHYVAYAEGAAVPGSISYGYYRVGHEASLDALTRLLDNRNQDCFCLNDHGMEDLGVEKAERWMHEILERLYPMPSTLEREGAGT